MAETQQTMTEFTYATGETGIVGDRFSPSVVLFWLRTSVAACLSSNKSACRHQLI